MSRGAPAAQAHPGPRRVHPTLLVPGPAVADVRLAKRCCQPRLLPVVVGICPGPRGCPSTCCLSRSDCDPGALQRRRHLREWQKGDGAQRPAVRWVPRRVLQPATPRGFPAPKPEPLSPPQETGSSWARATSSASTTPSRPGRSGSGPRAQRRPPSPWTGPLPRESCWRSRAST